MILGIDLGSSAVKLAAVENGELVHEAYCYNREGPAEKSALDFIRRYGIKPEGAVLTGVGSSVFDTSKLGLDAKFKTVPEIEAVAEGAAILTGLDTNLTVSIGTGTAFVLCRDGERKHIGGSAFGGGTMEALSRKILGEGAHHSRVRDLAAKGDVHNIDLFLSELPSFPPTLSAHTTAANLVKANENTRDEDWAIGILNMVLMTLGSMTYLASLGLGVDDFVFIGGPTTIDGAQGVMERLQATYTTKRFIIAPNAKFATAIGAAHLFYDN